MGSLKRIKNKQINKRQKSPEEEIRHYNSWYIGDQMEAAQKHTKPTIQHRYNFILRSINKYQENCERKSLGILDAGCGDGVQLQGLLQIPGLKVWGIDYNLMRTRRAQQKFIRVNIVCGDLLHVPFKPEAFDIVLCSQVIEHIPQDDFLLKELAKALKPDGLLILGTPNEGCLMARLRNYMLERNILKNTDHFHFYRESVIRRKIEAAGFAIKEVMRENWFFPHQLINYYLVSRTWGFKLMGILSRIIPSQTAGYYFKCVKR